MGPARYRDPIVLTASDLHAEHGDNTIFEALSLTLVLEAALRDYPGAIVAVSHDRAFLEAIGTHRRVRVCDGAVKET